MSFSLKKGRNGGLYIGSEVRRAGTFSHKIYLLRFRGFHVSRLILIAVRLGLATSILVEDFGGPPACRQFIDVLGISELLADDHQRGRGIDGTERVS